MRETECGYACLCEKDRERERGSEREIVRVCVRERGRERERWGRREGGRERETDCCRQVVHLSKRYDRMR